MSLEKLRDEITSIDEQLIKLLNRRMEIAGEVAAAKGCADSVYVPEREAYLLEKCRQISGNSRYQNEVEAIYTEIISTSKKIQKRQLLPGKKCVFLDLDGTLLNDERQVCERNRVAIEAALKEGHKMIVATGRPLESAIVGAQKMDLAKEGCYIASYNGGVLYDCTTKQKIFEASLEPEYTDYLFACARKAGIHIQAYCEGKVWAEEDNEELRSYCMKGQLEYEIHQNVPDELTERSGKVLLISYEEAKLKDFQKEMEAWAFGKVQSVFSTRNYLEYSPLGISKGHAVETLASLLGYDIKDTIAIGDEQNDISMILKAGLGVCMANGLDSIKEIADYVTSADNNEGGVAEVIEQFVLNKQ